jgi:hypothetical protein
MPFRYLKDPLFLSSLAIYFVNRCVLKPWFPNEFSLCYLNDLICLPFWVPIMLFLMRKARLRRVDTPPRAVELIIPLLVWSGVFELVLPSLDFFQRLTTPDYRDVLFYTFGAALAAVVWRIHYGEASPAHERNG